MKLAFLDNLRVVIPLSDLSIVRSGDLGEKAELAVVVHVGCDQKRTVVLCLVPATNSHRLARSGRGDTVLKIEFKSKWHSAHVPYTQTGFSLHYEGFQNGFILRAYENFHVGLWPSKSHSEATKAKLTRHSFRAEC